MNSQPSHFSGQASNGYETLKSICLFIYFPDRTILLEVSLWAPSRTHRMKDDIDFITKGCISFMLRKIRVHVRQKFQVEHKHFTYNMHMDNVFLKFSIWITIWNCNTKYMEYYHARISYALKMSSTRIARSFHIGCFVLVNFFMHAFTIFCMKECKENVNIYK